MVITRRFRVVELKATTIGNAPFTLTLEPGDVFIRKPSSVTVGKNNRLFVGALEPNLLGKGIEITFKQAVNPPEKSPELLIVASLTRTESVTFKKEFGVSRVTIKRLLVLATEVKVGAHPTPLPCPYYEFSIRLTEKEYQEVKSLPIGTVFNAFGVLL